jgi:hypothetical protein
MWYTSRPATKEEFDQTDRKTGISFASTVHGNLVGNAWESCLQIDIVATIFQFMELLDCLTLSHVSKSLYEVCNSQHVWKNRIVQFIPLFEETEIGNWKKITRMLGSRDFLLQGHEQRYQISLLILEKIQKDLKSTSMEKRHEFLESF